MQGGTGSDVDVVSVFTEVLARHPNLNVGRSRMFGVGCKIIPG